MKKHLLLALSLMFLLSACKWTGGTRGNNAEVPSPQDQDELQAAVSAMEDFFGKLADAVDDAFETGKLDTTAFSRPDETATDGQAEPELQEPDAWYAKDFAFKAVKHVYITANVTKSEGDATYIVTRIGNKAWIQQTVLGRVQYTDVYEYSDRCTTKQRFKNGRAVSTSLYKETSLGQCLAYQFVSGKDIPIAKPRSAATVQKTTDGTICGRPCRIIEEKVDEVAGGSRITFDRTVYVDKEYGFIYKMHSKGDTSAGKVDTTPYEVISFTDKPTAKDIPNYK